MKKVVLKYKQGSDLLDFLTTVKPVSYVLADGIMEIVCNDSDQIIRIAKKYGLVVVSEENSSGTNKG